MKTKKEYSKEIGARIKALRIERGITMEDFAKAIGYTSKTSTYNLEQGRQLISVPVLKKIAEVLNVSLYYLEFGEEPPKEILIERHSLSDITDLEYDLLLYFRKLSDVEKSAIVNILKKGD
ncbi:MAG: helix-turn-helix transcriptional regulator [Bacteroidales bacterium]|nr:helix-turn-helix transcriptional regulator [Candidatus Scybalousia scybalohippi]